MADAATSSSDPASGLGSPMQPPDSPSSSVSPSLALDAVPVLDRCVSTPASSSSSILSELPRRPRLSDGATTMGKRRGYMRPQGTSFADSARSRDSVMSLGSIAHMQYYFARTGLLDGKGAQLARGDMKQSKSVGEGKENREPSLLHVDEYGSLTGGPGEANFAAVSDYATDHGLVETPSEMSVESYFANGNAPAMLAPTVSTYKHKQSFTEPLPDMPVLRRELKEALQDACKVLEESQNKHNPKAEGQSDNTDGWYEIEGLHLLDIITLAIKAARTYYQAHTNPQRLCALRSDRLLRRDLFQVLDILKRMAARNFRGGMRLTELAGILEWIESIDKLVKQEEALEEAERAERESYAWRDGEWVGREREREWMFLKSFDKNNKGALPPWPEPAEDQTPPSEFLRSLQDGQRLVELHNALVAGSKRKYGDIKSWHRDVAKPYRMAENIRYWLKAAELRWEVKLDVPVMDVVHSSNETAWRKFDEAVLTWCRVVRGELTEEWRQEKREQSRWERRVPELKVETSAEAAAPATEAPAALDPAFSQLGPGEALTGQGQAALPEATTI